MKKKQKKLIRSMINFIYQWVEHNEGEIRNSAIDHMFSTAIDVEAIYLREGDSDRHMELFKSKRYAEGMSFDDAFNAISSVYQNHILN